MCAGCGCNFDRRQVLQTLEDAFAESVAFAYSYDANDDKEFDAVLLINGCDSECAQPSELRENIVIDHTNNEKAVEVFSGYLY